MMHHFHGIRNLNVTMTKVTKGAFLMTPEQAIELSKTKFWEKMTPREIATFQLFEEKLCMPFDVFHEAIEKTLGRPVWTHEFGMNLQGIKNELMGEAPMPTLEEIINLIPEEKRVVVSVG